MEKLGESLHNGYDETPLPHTIAENAGHTRHTAKIENKKNKTSKNNN